MDISKLAGKSRTTEVDTVTKQISTAFNESSVKDDVNLVNFFTEIIPLGAELTTAIHSIKSESMQEEKDSIRGDAVRSIYYMCTGFLHHPSTPIKGAATTVLNIFNSYGLEMTNESYAVESSLINSFLEQIGDDAIKAEIKKLPGVAQLVEALIVAEADFEQASLQYAEDKAEDSTHRSATKIKKDIIPLINDKLVLYLKTMVMINSDQYKEFAGTVAKLIENNNLSVKKRSGSGSAISAE